MKTTISTYTRGDKTVKVIGTCHMGVKNYYSKIFEEADKSDIVFYEKIKDVPQNFSLKGTYAQILDILNDGRDNKLILQASIKIPEDWINTDISLEDLKNMNQMPTINQMSNVNLNHVKKYKRFIFFLLKMAMKFKKIKNEEILIGVRNSLVILQLSRKLKKHNSFSIVYGEGHVNKFHKQITQMGFFFEGEEKVEVLK